MNGDWTSADAEKAGWGAHICVVMWRVFRSREVLVVAAKSVCLAHRFRNISTRTLNYSTLTPIGPCHSGRRPLRQHFIVHDVLINQVGRIGSFNLWFFHISVHVFWVRLNLISNRCFKLLTGVSKLDWGDFVKDGVDGDAFFILHQKVRLMSLRIRNYFRNLIDQNWFLGWPRPSRSWLLRQKLISIESVVCV